MKNLVISASIEKKPTTAIFGAQSGSRIYLNEHLIKETQALFNKARFKLIKEPIQGLKFYSVNHRDGVIRVKKTAGLRPIKIFTEADLDQLVAAMIPSNTPPSSTLTTLRKLSPSQAARKRMLTSPALPTTCSL
jgi:hypothetical protein